MEDTRIIQLYWDRDGRAIAATADKYGSYCTAIAQNILGSKEDAEECVNDAYLRAWNAIPPQKPNVLSAFLGRITRNLALNKYRRSSAEKRGGNELPIVLDELSEIVSDQSDIEQTIDQRELLRTINRFLGTLSSQKRSLFLCRYWYFDSISAIALQFHMTENSVSVTLNRIRHKLRRYLSERGFEL